MSFSQEELDTHHRAATLLQSMLADPRTAEKAEELVMQINPTAKFPMRERREALTAPIMGELEKKQKALDALEARLTARDERDAAEAAKRQEDSLLSRIDTVKRQRGFSDEMMDRVMQRMRDNNNPDVEAAAAFVSESIPKQAPATGYDFLPQQVDAFGSGSGTDQWKALHANPDGWLTSELRSIAKDPEFARLGQGQ